MVKILLILWQLPQYLVSLFWRMVTKTTSRGDYRGTTIRYVRKGGSSYGLSLVDIFLTDNFLDKSEETRHRTICHEYGHCIQSRRWGWLYLIVMGIPSALWANCIFPLWGYKRHTYYDFYVERNADKLGGVVR